MCESCGAVATKKVEAGVANSAKSIKKVAIRLISSVKEAAILFVGMRRVSKNGSVCQSRRERYPSSRRDLTFVRTNKSLVGRKQLRIT